MIIGRQRPGSDLLDSYDFNGKLNWNLNGELNWDLNGERSGDLSGKNLSGDPSGKNLSGDLSGDNRSGDLSGKNLSGDLCGDLDLLCFSVFNQSVGSGKLSGFQSTPHHIVQDTSKARKIIDAKESHSSFTHLRKSRLRIFIFTTYNILFEQSQKTKKGLITFLLVTILKYKIFL